MTSLSYFTLCDSGATRKRRFRVVMGGYDEVLDKKSSVDTTIEGTLDIAQGSIQKTWMMMVKFREQEVSDGDIYSDNNYGTKEDLEYFFRLNDPNANPSDVMELVDHRNVQHFVKMLGTLKASLLGVMIEGEEAWFLANCQFIKVG